MIVLYTIGCPKCDVLKEKLDKKGIHYITCTNLDEMKRLGIYDKPFPMLRVDDNILNFHDAIEYINKWKGE